MAKQIALEIELNGDKQVLRSMNDMNDAAEQLRMQMEAATDPEDIRRFGRELQKVEGHVKDIELQFESLDIEQRMTAATDVVAGVAGGFAAVEGAIALAGVESEAFEETMTKVMGAMAFAQGIRDMGTAAVAMKKLTDVTKIQAAAQRVLNFVMSMNPIGLIVTAIGLLIAGIIAFQKPIQNAIAKFESMNGVAKVLIGILAGPLLAAIYGVTKALEFFGVINSKTQNDAISAAEKRRRAEVKAHKERIKELNKEIDALDDQIAQIRKVGQAVELRYNREIELARAAGKETTKLEEGKLDETIETARKEIIALEERYRKEQDILRERTEIAKKEANVISDTFLDAQKQIVAGRRNEVAEAKNMLDELLHDRKVHNAEVAKEQSDAEEEARDRYRDHLEKMREIEMFLEDLRAENISDEYERELEQERLRYERLRDEYKGHAEVLEQLEIQHQANLLKIQEDERQRMRDADKDFRDEQANIREEEAKKREEEAKKREEGAKMQQEFYASLAAMGEEEEKKKLEAQEELLTRMTEARLRYEVGVVSTLQNVAKIIGEESEKGAKLAKAAAIIQVLIDTAKALSSAIAGAVAAASLTGPAGPFIMGSYIAAGVATVTGAFAQVKSILGKADANMPSLGSATAGATGGARINPVQSGNTQIDANGNSIQDTQEMKVHVVESEISEVQGRVSVIENQASAR